MKKNKQVILKKRSNLEILESNFEVVDAEIPPINVGEFLIRAHYLSVDPYMRGRIDEEKSYAEKVEIGEVMVGTVVGMVVESSHDKFLVGDFVEARTGWQLYGICNGSGIRKLKNDGVPLTANLGTVGMPGVTAWIGLNVHAQPIKGETVVVSAASGAVGSVVGQLSKLKGCRVIGIAGGHTKCDYVVNELGFDACLNYKDKDFQKNLRDTCNEGVDVYFDNVGGIILDSILNYMNPFSRIVLCGQISGYSDPSALTVHNFRSFLINRIQLKGFICSDHMDLWRLALSELGDLVKSGQLKYKESIAIGLDSAPKALIGLMEGKNFGKQLVKLL
jgi:hypothetical protein